MPFDNSGGSPAGRSMIVGSMTNSTGSEAAVEVHVDSPLRRAAKAEGELKETKAESQDGNAREAQTQGSSSGKTEGSESKLDVIICHARADFDSIGAAVGLARLRTLLAGHPDLIAKKTKRNRKVRIVFGAGEDNSVKSFLSLYRNEFPLASWKTIRPQDIAWIGVVDCQDIDRIGKPARDWLNLPSVRIHVYDHHVNVECSIPAHEKSVERVGSSTTIIVEKLRALALDNVGLTPAEATVMALGIHADTGSLTFENTTPRDANALAWLLANGANQCEISTYQHESLSPQLQTLLSTALADMNTHRHYGYTIATVILRLPSFVQGLAKVCYTVMELTGADAVLMGAVSEEDTQLSLIGRAKARLDGVDLSSIFKRWRGGGHPKAAAASVKRCSDPEGVVSAVVADIVANIARPPCARDIMRFPVYTVPPEVTMQHAMQVMYANSCSGLVVVESATGAIVGVVTMRDAQLAEMQHLETTPVKAFMNRQPVAITEDTPLHEIEELIRSSRWPRLPVLAQDGKTIVGVVTRSDVVRKRLHEDD